MTKITAWKRQAGSTLWSVVKYKVVNHIIWHFTWNLAREPLFIRFKTKLANFWSTLQSEIQNSVMGSRPLECDFLHWVSNSRVFPVTPLLALHGCCTYLSKLSAWSSSQFRVTLRKHAKLGVESNLQRWKDKKTLIEISPSGHLVLLFRMGLDKLFFSRPVVHAGFDPSLATTNETKEGAHWFRSGFSTVVWPRTTECGLKRAKPNATVSFSRILILIMAVS